MILSGTPYGVSDFVFVNIITLYYAKDIKKQFYTCSNRCFLPKTLIIAKKCAIICMLHYTHYNGVIVFFVIIIVGCTTFGKSVHSDNQSLAMIYKK